MNAASFRHRVRPTEITVLGQAAILGFLLGELWYLSQTIASAINVHILSSSRQGEALISCGITVLIGSAYFYIREGYSDIQKLWSSYRFDLLMLVLLGVSISVSVGGVGTLEYQEYVGKANAQQLMLLVAIPIAIALMLVSKVGLKFTLALIRSTRAKPTPFFLNDQDIKSAADDLLGLNVSATRFAQRVLNGGSSDSLVFGIDAPWGIGKSSFVNFCCEYWQTKSRSQLIVHRFEPLRYKDSTDLVDKFVNELVNTIQKHAFVPSIRSLFSKYLRLIKGKSEFSFLGLKFEFETSSGTVEETLKNLEVHLSELNIKIIIVVDDLDRLSWTEVKNILYAIKRSFMLPNVSYVLCYDTENLALLEKTFDDAEKVKEFLEKFVNVKIGLFLDSSTLSEYVSTNFNSVLKNNLQLDTHLLDQIKQALEALADIYNSPDYIFYQDFLGDIRKLKRLINTMMLFEIQKTDFKNSDYNKEDLIHLLLVYINYPNIFRRIYNAETGGHDGFFSLIPDNTNSTSGIFVNSNNYVNYLKRLNENSQFLLNKIFHADIPFGDTINLGINNRRIDPAVKMTRACFNGRGYSGRNLERYLYLIVKLSKQDKRDGYQFYVNKKNDLIRGEPLDIIFQNEDFGFSKGDFARDQLWRVIANSTDEIKPNIGSQVASYLMEHLPDYSFFEREKVGSGSRVRLVYSLLKLLDEAAWGISITGRRNNNEKNISEIADWIFGEHSHAGAGVISTLSEAKRGPLGLYDLLLFRLYCSADRGGSLFNLQRAVSLHGNPAAPTSGITTEIAKEGMREISQVIFQVFLKQYIEPKKSIFEAVDNLSLDNFAGKSAEFVRKQIDTKKVSQELIDELIAVGKIRVISFIIYQLGNSIISSGVGCGYYDESGNNDQKGIAARINEYLFDQCFNPSISPNNFERFLDYLLINFAHTFDGSDGFSHVPTPGEFTKVLDMEKLKEYWNLHRLEILELNYTSMEKNIFTSNYVATYEKNLPAVYRVLDELIGVTAS